MSILSRFPSKFLKGEDIAAGETVTITVQSTPESGARAGFDGHKKRKGSKVHIAVDTLGHYWPWQSHPPTNRIGSRWAN